MSSPVSSLIFWSTMLASVGLHGGLAYVWWPAPNATPVRVQVSIGVFALPSPESAPSSREPRESPPPEKPKPALVEKPAEEKPAMAASPAPTPPRIDPAPKEASLPTTEPKSIPTAVEAPASQASRASTGAKVDQLPIKLPSNPAPPYPPEVRANNQHGTVLLRVEVTAQGTVADISVHTSSGIPALDEAALTTVRTWRFQPARRGGTDVACIIGVPIVFSLK